MKRMCIFVLGCLFKISVMFFGTEDIMQKDFHVRSNLHLTHFENFQEKALEEKTLHVEGNKIPKLNLKCTCRFTPLLNLDTVCMMFRSNIDGATPFSCKQIKALLCLW